MSNTKAFTTSITSARDSLTVTDAVTYSDPLRADVKVYFAASKVDYNNVEDELVVTSDDSDPATDSSWSFDYELDGYYKMRYIAVPAYNVGTTYAQYAAVYSGSVVYRSKVADNVGQSVSDTDYWEVVTATDLCDNKGGDSESENCDSTIYERVFTANHQYGYGNCVSQNSMHTESDDEDLIRPYDKYSLMLNGAITYDERTEVLSGEIVCRRMDSMFSEFID